MTVGAALAVEPRRVGDARLEPVAFTDLSGWPEDDHAAAFAAFRRTCEAMAKGQPSLRPAAAVAPDLAAICRDALKADAAADPRGFFERSFQPFRVLPPGKDGFLTGYFEPEVQGSLDRTEAFPAPLLARPDDLVTISQGETLPGIEPALGAARRTPVGFEPYPDRAAIEDGALGERARPIVHLRDPVDAFIVQVQGSARISLADGQVVRVAYAGKNGYPFTVPGRIIVARGHVPLAEMNLERLTAWLRANPEEGREIMRLNRSYVFFRLAEELDAKDGPVGAAGVPLTAGRSLATDRNLWSYGLPFWLEGELPLAGGGTEPLARLPDDPTPRGSCHTPGVGCGAWGPGLP
jgi:membrane-bound lytic murein transglycosylase A